MAVGDGAAVGGGAAVGDGAEKAASVGGDMSVERTWEVSTRTQNASHAAVSPSSPIVVAAAIPTIAAGAGAVKAARPGGVGVLGLGLVGRIAASAGVDDASRLGDG